MSESAAKTYVGTTWAVFLGGCVLVGSIVSFFGWVLGIPRLTDWFNGGVSIQPNACLLLALSGAAIMLAQRKTGKVVLVLLILGALIVMGGSLILLQYVLGVDFGINDLLLFGQSWGQLTTLTPGRVGPPAATCFSLIGLALIFLAQGASATRFRRLRRFVPALGIVVCLITTFSLLGYVFQARQFYTIPGLTAIALQTALMLLMAGAGTIISVPEHQPMLLLREESGTATLARITLPALAVMIPAVLWFRIAGYERGYYDAGTGRALEAWVLLVGSITILWIALMFLRAHEQALRTSEARLRGVIEQLPALVGVMDKAGVWTLSNAQMDFYAPRAIPSTLPDRLMRWQTWDEHGRLLPPENWPGKRALRGETVFPGLTMRYTHDDGRELWWTVSAAPLRDSAGDIIGGTYVMQDVTHLQRLEIALQEKVQELAAADRRKDEFLATLAHELRNPLAPVMNALALLDRAEDDRTIAAKARATMRRQLGQMVRLIDDLLDVSRISGGRIALRKEIVQLQPVIQNAVESVKPKCETAQQRIIVDLPSHAVWIEADPVRLAQVVANLLTNASRYSEKGQDIFLKADTRGIDLLLKVQDRGIGIPTEHLEEIFGIFSQLDRRLERESGGLGIGLYLVRRLVEMHGGIVTAHSDGAGAGSTFTIRLPIVVPSSAAPRQAPVPPREAHGSSGERVKALVVDDNQDSAQSLAMLLQTYGYSTQTAHNGVEAVEAAARFDPDLILLDIGLPELNGYEACKRIRQQPGGTSRIVIALSGWGQEEDRRQSERSGFDAHLVKPIEPAGLMEVVESFLKSR